MEFLDIAKKRYSVRNYTEQKVEAEKLEQILEAAHVAPTAANLQPVHLVVAQSEEALQKVGKAANIYNAPVAVIVCADHDKAWVRPFDHKNTCDIDASILTDHMMLQQRSLGLAVYGCVILSRMSSKRNLRFRIILSRSTFWSSDMPTKMRRMKIVTKRQEFR